MGVSGPPLLIPYDKYVSETLPLLMNCITLEEQRRFFVDNLMFGVQLADVSTRCSSHLQGKGEVILVLYTRGCCACMLMRLSAEVKALAPT